MIVGYNVDLRYVSYKHTDTHNQKRCWNFFVYTTRYKHKKLLYCTFSCFLPFSPILVPVVSCQTLTYILQSIWDILKITY